MAQTCFRYTYERAGIPLSFWEGTNESSPMWSGFDMSTRAEFLVALRGFIKFPSATLWVTYWHNLPPAVQANAQKHTPFSTPFRGSNGFRPRDNRGGRGRGAS
eukprot:GHVT01025944.1.p2 GENE.GHVT01025944.1~~GHVT01025944.1.p2  ORF type:complete len:103 (-),score=4.12 GHVT01025944.1:326-634(-)